MAQKPFEVRLDRLLEVTARVFADKGYHPTTMRDLARETGLSLAGMYHYVRGKDELLFLIQERCFTRVMDGAEAAVAGLTDPADRLRAFIVHHVTFFARHMSEMKVLSHEAESLRDERLAEINRLKRRYVDHLIGLIEAVGTAGDRGLDPHVAAYALFGMMNWIYTWYDPQGTVPPDALADQFARLFVDGLSASPPSPTAVSHGG